MGERTVQRRAEDLNDLIEHLQLRRVAPIGWSLGVMEGLMFVSMHGDSKVAALVFVDNSVGESPGQKGGDEKNAGSAMQVAIRKSNVALLERKTCG